ncbi:hypothetical protein OSTOST_16265 [Ostertagia ostertagi]
MLNTNLVDIFTKIEEEDFIDEDEGVFVDLSAPLNNENQENPIQAVLHSNTDATTWYEEVERVTPLLKITIRQDAKIADEVEKSLERIETREADLLYITPMMKVKQAILKIEEEIQRMNVQIGVLEQSLLQAQLKERVSYAAEAYGVA